MATCPVTGGFVHLVQRGFYDGMDIQRQMDLSFSLVTAAHKMALLTPSRGRAHLMSMPKMRTRIAAGL